MAHAVRPRVRAGLALGGGGMTLLAIAALSLTCLAVTVLNLRGGRWWE